MVSDEDSISYAQIGLRNVLLDLILDVMFPSFEQVVCHDLVEFSQLFNFQQSFDISQVSPVWFDELGEVCHHISPEHEEESWFL